jgi:hypothetical protein
MKILIAKLFAIATIHVGVGVLFYGLRRVRGSGPFFQSDLAVFVLPAFLALIAYGVVLWLSKVLSTQLLFFRLLFVGICAGASAFLSLWMSFIIAADMFGT